jgi:Ca2+-binding EF-hand superfamily protein
MEPPRYSSPSRKPIL